MFNLTKSTPGVTNLYATESYFLRPINAKGCYSLLHTSEMKFSSIYLLCYH